MRQATLGDAAEVSRLVTELGYAASVDMVVERLRRILSEDRFLVLVAVGDDGGLLGWVNAEERLTLESGTTFEIVGLVVDATARRRGIARSLVTAVEHWARSRGATSVRVRSNVNRDESHPFYETAGYRRLKTQHAYVKELTAEGSGLR